MEGVLGVWLITFRAAWPAVAIGAVFLAVAMLALAAPWTRDLPPARAFLTILFSPLAVVLWSGVNWAREENLAAGTMPWRSDILLALALCAVIVAIAVPIRYRRSPRWRLLIPCSLTAIVYTAAAAFVGGMAIVNGWI